MKTKHSEEGKAREEDDNKELKREEEEERSRTVKKIENVETIV